MSIEEKIALLEETIDVEEGSLQEDTLLEEIDEYDSMAKLSLIAMFDEEFGITLEGDTVKGFTTVKDIIDQMK